MSFLGLPPAAALSLLAGVAGLVLLLYLIKPSARRLAVASSLIWQRVLEQRKRKPDRWRWWLSLLLALAIGLSIALALTRPELSAIGGSAADVLVVVDTSPSMGARAADGRTRLELAVIETERILAAAGAGSRFMLIDTTHQIRTPVFEPRVAVGARVRTLVPGLAKGAWFPDLAALPGLRSNRQLWFVTDGVAPMNLPSSVRVASVFRNADNVGITAFEVRAAPGDPRRHDALVQVSNASAGGKAVRLRVAGVGGAPLERTVQVPGGASTGVVLDVSALDQGPLRASVASEGDGLALDDVAYAYLPAKRRVRVVLVTPGNAALARTLRMLPQVQLQVLPPSRLASLPDFDAVILDRVTPQQAPIMPALLIAPRGGGWLGRAAGQVDETYVAGWDVSHPLLARVALSDVLIEHVVPLRADVPAEGAPRWTVVASGPRAEPLMLATHEGARLAVIAFPLDASNFPQQASFPAFLTNAVHWLTREAAAVARPLGQVAVPAHARVLDLDGSEVITREVPGAALFEAHQPGLYTAMTSGQRLRIAANLLDARVTAVNASALVASPQTPSLSPAVRGGRVDPWILLLVAAALLLAIEWWTYNRRMTL